MMENTYIDFEVGMVVFLENEYGTVTESEKIGNSYGLIRWDTNKDKDLEDWRGLFGSFISNGGKIIDKPHDFQHIDNNGNLKVQ